MLLKLKHGNLNIDILRSMTKPKPTPNEAISTAVLMSKMAAEYACCIVEFTILDIKKNIKVYLLEKMVYQLIEQTRIDIIGGASTKHTYNNLSIREKFSWLFIAKLMKQLPLISENTDFINNSLI